MGGSGLHAEGGIDDVRAGEAHMDESGVRGQWSRQLREGRR